MDGKRASNCNVFKCLLSRSQYFTICATYPYESEMDIWGVYMGLQNPWLKLNLGGESEADEDGVIRDDEDKWLAFIILCMSPTEPPLWCPSGTIVCALCPPDCGTFPPTFPVLAFAFVSDDEFVSLVQLLTPLCKLLLFGVVNRWVRIFSSRRHFARLLENHTWIRASGSPILAAKRSRAKTSG